jgi:tripartite-type tricarboxylate transporter receptor subunit TctC
VQEGAEPIGSTPEEFGAHIQRELARVARVVREAGIKIE